MPQYETIPQHEQGNVLAAFWMMLRGAEQEALSSNKALDKHFVESYYELWNRVTNSNQQPAWMTKNA